VVVLAAGWYAEAETRIILNVFTNVFPVSVVTVIVAVGVILEGAKL